MQKINQTALPEKEEFAKKNCPCRSDLADIVAYPYPVGELQRRVVKPMGKWPKSAEPEPLSEFEKEDDTKKLVAESFSFNVDRYVARQMNKMLQNTMYADAKWYACRDADKDEYIARKHGNRSFVRLTISSEAMAG